MDNDEYNLSSKVNSSWLSNLWSAIVISIVVRDFWKEELTWNDFLSNPEDNLKEEIIIHEQSFREIKDQKERTERSTYYIYWVSRGEQSYWWHLKLRLSLSLLFFQLEDWSKARVMKLHQISDKAIKIEKNPKYSISQSFKRTLLRNRGCQSICERVNCEKQRLSKDTGAVDVILGIKEFNNYLQRWAIFHADLTPGKIAHIQLN